MKLGYRKVMHTEFWRGKLLVNVHLKNRGHGRIILRKILGK
jgi:hypothetical protein